MDEGQDGNKYFETKLENRREQRKKLGHEKAEEESQEAVRNINVANISGRERK